MLLRKQAAGKIQGLRRQRPFKLRCSTGETVAVYRADFEYIENGRRVIEDAKGHLTAMYKLKRAWMLKDHGITIRETYEKKPETW